MGVDVASLVLAVDASQVDQGSASLNKLAEASKKAEDAASKFAKDLERQIAIFGKTKHEVLQYDASLIKMTASQREHVNGLLSQVAAQEKFERTMALATRGVIAMATAATTAAATIGYIAVASINAADAMNDLHLKTGMAFKDLAAFDLLAQRSGTTVEGVAHSFKFLARELTLHPEQMKKLGVSSRDGATAFEELADVIKSIEDPMLAAAVAQKALGRGGMEMLPLLKGGSEGVRQAREETARYGKQLEDMAPRADAFNDKLALLKIHNKELGLTIGEFLLPAMTSLVETANDMAAGGTRFDKAIDSMKEKTDSFTLKLIPQVRIFRAWLDLVERFPTAAALAGVGEDQSKRTRTGSIGDSPADLAAFDKATAEYEKEFAARKKAKADAEAYLKGDSDSKKYAASVKAADAFIKKLQEEAAQIGLNAEQKKMLQAEQVALTLRTDDGRMAVMKAAAAWADATRAEADAAAAKKFTAEAIASANRAISDHETKLGAEVAAAERALQIYGLTKSQIEEVTIARLEENLAIERARDADAATLAYYEREIDARKRIKAAIAGVETKDIAKKAAEDAAKAWDRAADDISRALTDALMRGFEDGKSFAQNFLDAVQATFKATVLKIAVQAVMDPINAGIKGMLGGSGGMPSLSGVSNFFSDGASSLGFGAAQAGVNTAAYSAFGSMGMEQAAMLAAQDSVFGMAGTAATLEAAGATMASTLATALPYVGIALAAAQMLGVFEGDGPAERSATVKQWGNTDGYEGQYATNSKIGGITPWANNKWFSEDMWASQKAFGEELIKLDNKIADTIDMDQMQRIQDALAADTPTSVGFGIEHTDWRQSGADEFIMTERYQIILNALQAGLGDLAAQGGITADEVENAVAGLKAAKQATVDAANAQIESQKKITDGWQRVADSILKTIEKLRGDIGTPEQSFAKAQADFFINTAAARAGDQGAAANLPAMAMTLVDLGKTMSATRVEQQMLTARTIQSLQGTVGSMAKFGITVPAFDVGTEYVPFDMLAKIHEGEKITPKAFNPAANGGSSDELIAEIRELRNEVVGLRNEVSRQGVAATSTAASTRKTSDILQRITRDGEGMLISADSSIPVTVIL